MRFYTTVYEIIWSSNSEWFDETNNSSVFKIRLLNCISRSPVCIIRGRAYKLLKIKKSDLNLKKKNQDRLLVGTIDNEVCMTLSYFYTVIIIITY